MPAVGRRVAIRLRLIGDLRLVVGHREFRAMGAATLRNLGKPRHVLYDLKYVLARDEADLRL